MADELDSRDRLAAALAGMLFAGMADRPVAMAEQLLADGWRMVDPGVPEAPEREQRLLGALLTAGQPLTASHAITRAVGYRAGGRSWCLWRESLQSLIDSGRVQEAGTSGKRQRWTVFAMAGDTQ